MKEWIDTRDARRVDSRILLIGFGLLPVIGMVVFGVSALAYGVRGIHVWMLALAIITAMITTIPLVLDSARPPGRRHMLLTLNLLAHIVFFVAPIFTTHLLEDPGAPVVRINPGYIEQSMLVQAQLAVILGMLSMLAGYATGIGRVLASPVPTPHHEWTDRAGLVVACVGIPIGWCVFLAAVFGLVTGAVGTSIFEPFMGFTVTGIGLLAMIWMRSKSRLALVLIAVLIPITMGFNFFTGSKGDFFAPLIVLGLTYVVVRRRIPLRWVLAGFVAVVLFYPVSHFYRHVLGGLARGTVAMLQNPGEVLRDTADFASTYGLREWLVDGFGSTLQRFNGLGILGMIIQTTPEEVPFQGGWTIAYAAIFWIPRFLWPGKPNLQIGGWIYENYTVGAGVTETSVGSTWFGELYLNFGWVGIPIGMFAVGILMRFLHEILFARSPTIPMLLAGASLINQTARALGGTLISPISGTFWSIAPVVTLHVIVRFLGGTVPRTRSTPNSPPVEAIRAPSGTAGPSASP